MFSFFILENLIYLQVVFMIFNVHVLICSSDS